MRYYLLILISTLTFSLVMCKSPAEKNPGNPATKETASLVNVPDFSADSAFHYIEKQLSFGPRVPNSQASRDNLAWMKETLLRFTPDVTVQNARILRYDGVPLEMNNVIASFNKENTSRILLAAHWDSRPWADEDPDPANHNKPVPAANDGASGVGVLLEIARQFSRQNPAIGVDIVLFDAEDSGELRSSNQGLQHTWALGSQYWSRKPHKTGYKARFGILLDMVGAKNAVFPQEQTSVYYAPQVLRNVWETAGRLGYGSFFVNRKEGAVTDDHTYINEILGIPTIDIIDFSSSRPFGFFEQWHTVDDDIQHIDKSTLKAVGQTVMTVVYEAK